MLHRQEKLINMEFFALDEEVDSLESWIRNHPDDLPGLITLAWHLRQRDWARALRIADTCDAQLTQSATPHPAHEQHTWQYRLLLVRGDIAWLNAQLETAAACAQRVLAECDPQQHQELLADAWLLAGRVHKDRGQIQERNVCWRNMYTAATEIGDQTRAGFAEVSLGTVVAITSASESQSLRQKYLAADLNQFHPALRAAVHDFLGIQLQRSNDLTQSLACFMQSYAAASKTGQIRRAILAAANVASTYLSLNEQNAALEWAERSLELARPTNWPEVTGSCLTILANCLRHLNRLDAAQEMVDEALHIMQTLTCSPNYGMGLLYAGDLALARKEYPRAMQAFRQLQERADALLQTDFQINARRGQAQTLALLGHYEEAQDMAWQALRMARDHQDVHNQIDILRTLAKLHTGQHLAAPPDLPRSHPGLHFLLQALQLSTSIKGNIPGAGLLDEIADIYAAEGDFEQAYTYSRQANYSREKSQLAAASKRAHLLQVRRQVEHVQAESARMRQLAVEENLRAQILQDTSSTLSHLSAIAQEVTAQLDLSNVFDILRNHVRNLLDADYFAIFLCDADGRGLHSIFSLQNGQHLPPSQVALDNPHSFTARCLREQEEIAFSIPATQDSPARRKDAQPTQSALFGPLTSGHLKLGVMTIQSPREHAYGERERLIFRNLCAYGAIALHNARAYQQLQETQQQLVAQEKLAELGALVSGVANELEIPLDESLRAGATLGTLNQELSRNIQHKALNRGTLQTHISTARELLGVLMRDLRSAANLVICFKQVAVDRTSEQWRPFDLQQTLQEILATVSNQVHAAGHQVSLTVQDRIMMYSYPGPLGQVVMNLVNNALLHAYPEKSGGHMHLLAKQVQAERVEIIFSDDGCGIPTEDLQHIFEPFFATSLRQGDNGLSLSVSYNIVTSVLGGRMRVTSRPGEGCSFILDLPQSVTRPQHQEQ